MTVTLDERGLLIDGAHWPLVSGEFEYWRNLSPYWGRLLDLMKDAGLATVATFVCWDFHEVERGEFDFTGRTHPSRDLVGWLDLCHERDMKVLLRVGPVHDAEWPGRGPAPDVWTRERIDPEFLTRTREYITALGAAVATRQFPAGPVIAICLDNEVYFPYTAEEEGEPTAGTIPIPYDEKLVLTEYRRWLNEKYGALDALNDAWATRLKDWTNIKTPRYATAGLAETLDSFEFISAVLVSYLRELRDMCRAAGFTVPAYVNTRQFTEYIDWPAIETVVDSQGINAYMGRLVPGEQGLVMNWYFRLQQARRRLFWAPEFQSGAPIGMEDITGILEPDHLRFFSQAAMALGLRGANWYMFVERDDWHWAPLNPVGKLRPQYEVMKENIRILMSLRPDEQAADVGLLWFLDHNRAFMASENDTWTTLQLVYAALDRPKEFAGWWAAFRSLLEADMDFVLLDPRVRDPSERPVLIYAGPDFVPAREWERVALAVEGGAHLIVATPLPTHSPYVVETRQVLAATERVVATGRVTETTPGAVAVTAGRVGARSYVAAEPRGLWSMARRRGKEWVVGVVNPTERPLVVRLSLGQEILTSPGRYEVSMLIGGTGGNTKRAFGAPQLRALTISLQPKRAEIIKIKPLPDEQAGGDGHADA